MSRANLDVIRALFDAWYHEDETAALACFDPDVVFMALSDATASTGAPSGGPRG